VAALRPAIVAPLSGVATQRLSLQPLGREDLDELTAMPAHREVWEFEYGRGLTRSESEGFLDRQIKLCDQYGCQALAMDDAALKRIATQYAVACRENNLSSWQYDCPF
jgi:hypothetical protein